MMDFDRREHWRDPESDSPEVRAINDGKLHRFSTPQFYLGMDVGKQIVMNTLPRYIHPSMSILEYGCNTGKCLVELKRRGFNNLTGLEISPKALALGRKTFKEHASINFINAALEDVVKELPRYDVIYGVGVLMHLPYELDWVLSELFSRANVFIMTTENEFDTDGYFKWARKYKGIVEALGWVQAEEENASKYPPYPNTTIKRVFMRDDIESID